MNFLRHFLQRNFFLAMALLVLAVVVTGFSRTIDANLFHPDRPRPAILWLHAALFSSWVLLFVVQAALVRVLRAQWHRRFGITAAVLGCALPLLGTGAAIFMTHWRHVQEADGLAFLAVSFYDMGAFAANFALALICRKRPDWHKRFMLMAHCSLTSAAFARFPPALMPGPYWYVAVDCLILLGMLRDLLVDRRVHPTYLRTLPCMALAQAAAMYLYLAAPPWWVGLMRNL